MLDVALCFACSLVGFASVVSFSFGLRSCQVLSYYLFYFISSCFVLFCLIVVSSCLVSFFFFFCLVILSHLVSSCLIVLSHLVVLSCLPFFCFCLNFFCLFPCIYLYIFGFISSTWAHHVKWEKLSRKEESPKNQCTSNVTLSAIVNQEKSSQV